MPSSSRTASSLGDYSQYEHRDPDVARRRTAVVYRDPPLRSDAVSTKHFESRLESLY